MQRFLFIFIVMVGFAGGCSTAPKTVTTVSPGETSLKDLCESYHVQWSFDSVGQVITLRKGDQNATALIGSEMVMVGEEMVVLSAPIKRTKSTIVVPSDFRLKIIGRLEEPLAARKKLGTIRRAREIIIDAGHGGKDPGAIGRTGTHEKEIVLDISRRLKRILEKKGFKVHMTRGTDTFIPLPERTEIASRTKADLFVSIHANSHPSRSVSGVEVYASKYLSYGEREEDQRKKNQEILFDHLKIKREPLPEAIISDLLYTKKLADSDTVGKNVAEVVTRYAKARNLGLKHSRFFVLRNTLIPAVLVEVGFLSNPQEERLLNTRPYRQKIADSLARSILEYVNTN